MENEKTKKQEELQSRRDFLKKQRKAYYQFWVL